MDRIKAICSLVRPCNLLADIGCDHGFVAKHAVDIGVNEVIAADISEGSLNKARKLLEQYKNVSFFLSDGFDDIPVCVDEAVISGMGGLKIIDIVSRCRYKPVLILGAQHNQRELREFLVCGGYRITEDFCVFDRGKYYDFIRAEAGPSEGLTDVQLRYGVFYRRRNPDLERFALESEEKLRKYKRTQENNYKLALIEEVLRWQK